MAKTRPPFPGTEVVFGSSFFGHLFPLPRSFFPPGFCGVVYFNETCMNWGIGERVLPWVLDFDSELILPTADLELTSRGMRERQSWTHFRRGSHCN